MNAVQLFLLIALVITLLVLAVLWRALWRATRPVDPGQARENTLSHVAVYKEHVAELEPACVTYAPSGSLNVDYSKLCVLLLAEVRELKSQMSTLTARLL